MANLTLPADELAAIDACATEGGISGWAGPTKA
jgi:hypothetical protein